MNCIFLENCRLMTSMVCTYNWITHIRVCLFLGFASHLRIYHSCGNTTTTGEGLQILSYTRLSWPLSSEVSLACHTYCDKGHSFIMLICEDSWHSLQAFGSGVVTTCFYDLSLSWLGFEHQTFSLRNGCSNRLHHCGGHT